MAVSFVGAGPILEKGAGGTTAAVQFPASVAANDLAVVAFGENSATVLDFTANGWSTARSQASTGDTLVPALILAYKFLAGTEGGTSPNITVPSAAGSGDIMVFRGVDLTTPLDVALTGTVGYIDRTTTGVTTFVIPGFNTTVVGTALVYACIQNSATGPSTPPSNIGSDAWVEDADRVAGRNFCCGHLLRSGSGATGNVTVTLNTTTRGLAMMLALRPAASGFADSASLSGSGTLTTTQAPGPTRTSALSGSGTLATTGARGGTGIQMLSMSAQASNSGATVDVDYPPGLTAGDLILAYLSCNSGTLVAPSAPGWSQLGATAASDFTQTGMYAKVATGSESASATFSATGANFMDGQMFRLVGVDASILDATVASNFANNSTGDPLTWSAGGRTPGNTGALSIVAARGRPQGRPTTINTSGWVELANANTGVFAKGDLTSGVATGAISFTVEARSPANSASSVHVLLRPATATAFTGSADFTGTGTLSTAQAPGFPVAAALSGSGSLSTTQVPRPTQVAALSGTGTLATTQVPRPVVAVALSGTGTLSTITVPQPTQSLSLTGSGTLTTTQKPTFPVAVALSGSGTLTAFRLYDVTTVEWGSSGTGTGWVNPSNAVGPDDSTYATWTSTTASAVSAPLVVGFGTFAAVPSDAINISVRVRVKGYWS